MSSLPRPNLEAVPLLELFPTAGELAGLEKVPAPEVPSPYDRLLVHRHHMTVTLENFHRDRIDVRVLTNRQAGTIYARKIVLALRKSGRLVEFGLMRVNLRFLSSVVRNEIFLGWKPLGRILIDHNVFRVIEPTAFFRVQPGPALVQWFGLKDVRPVFGRTAIIHCNHQPAIEVLEVVAVPR